MLAAAEVVCESEREYERARESRKVMRTPPPRLCVHVRGFARVCCACWAIACMRGGAGISCLAARPVLPHITGWPCRPLSSSPSCRQDADSSSDKEEEGEEDNCFRLVTEPNGHNVGYKAHTPCMPYKEETETDSQKQTDRERAPARARERRCPALQP